MWYLQYFQQKNRKLFVHFETKPRGFPGPTPPDASCAAKKEDESRGFPGCEYAIFLHQSIQNRPLPGQGSGILGVFLGALHISVPRGHRPILHTMYNMYCKKSQTVDRCPPVPGGGVIDEGLKKSMIQNELNLSDRPRKLKFSSPVSFGQSKNSFAIRRSQNRKKTAT